MIETIYSNPDFLMHHGVKGQKWGVRRYQNEDGTLTPEGKRVDREAKKDAEEFARAKMYYGEGAGNRRKLIKATVESKKKKDPVYAEAFEHHLELQDMGQRAVEARNQRQAADMKKKTVSLGKKAIRGGGTLLRMLG